MTPKVFKSVADARSHFGPCALAIGNFDGVHIAHQALLTEVVRCASRKNLIPAVLTFEPHPTAIVAPERTPELICSLDSKLALLASFGMKRILVLPFTPETAGLTPAEFVSQILADVLETKALFVGENFRFGCRQAGTPDTLTELGVEFSFAPKFLSPVSFRGEIVSSSAVRGHLKAGRISRANRLLGRCFSISGPVVSGHGVGSRQTVPTLNLRPVPGRVLPRGVFITETVEPSTGRRWPSITNAGMRPTFNGDELTVETFLLAPLTGPTPDQITVEFHRFVRHERQFPSPEELKAQIMKDVGRAQTYWRRARNVLRTSPSSIY